jgi:pimeloyl-ACP methyl ester carboxylesterase
MNTPAYLSVGEGDHGVICIHGWLGDRRSFEATWDFLDRRNFTYAFMDARGYGAARAAEGDYTIAEIAQDIIELANTLGWDRFSLIGHSMGGMAVQRILCSASERVRSIIGISPVPASGARFDDEGWKTFTAAVEDIKIRRGIFEFITAGKYTSTFIDKVVADSLRIAPRALDSYLRSHVSDDFHREIEGNSTPALVILGDDDPATGVEGIQETWGRWYRQLDVRSLGNAAHLSMSEVPLSVVATTESFLLQH